MIQFQSTSGPQPGRHSSFLTVCPFGHSVSIHVRTAARTTPCLMPPYFYLEMFQSTSGPQPGRHLERSGEHAGARVSIHVRTAARTTPGPGHAAARWPGFNPRPDRSPDDTRRAVRLARDVQFQSTSGPQPGRHGDGGGDAEHEAGFNPRPDRSPDDTRSSRHYG